MMTRLWGCLFRSLSLSMSFGFFVFFLHFQQENAQSTSFSSMYRERYLPFPGIINVSTVLDTFLTLMRNTVSGQKQANGTIIAPWIEFLETLVEDDTSMLPTIVPHQTAPLPSLRTDLYCNPGFFPNGCTNLDELGKMIGVPLADWFHTSYISTAQRIMAHILNNIYSEAVYGVTPSLVNFLHQTERLNGTVSSLKNVLNPLVTIPSDSPLWKTITNITALVFWDVFLKRIDISDEDRLDRFHFKRQARSAFLCHLFNERLPICANLTKPVIAEKEIPAVQKTVTLSLATDVKTGFRLEIEIVGFEASCRYAPAECEISGFPSNPEQFDGRYKFMGLDDLGYPLYQKTGVSFSRFQAIKSLWLFVVGFIGPIFPQGITAMIMPNQPTYIGAAFQSRIPFAIYAGIPKACVTASSFPLCLSSTEKPEYLESDDPLFMSQRGTVTDDRELTGWLLARSSLSMCVVTQDRNNGLCEIPVYVQIY